MFLTMALLFAFLVATLWTCAGKGGRYMILNVCSPAGMARGLGEVITYIDVDSGDVYYRLWEDFNDRMVRWSGGNCDE